jgi:hypothetical protein
MSLKTPRGIDPRTIRLVAQRLNHYATPGPQYEHKQILKTTSWKSPPFTLKIHEKFISSIQRKNKLQKGPKDVKR